MTAVLTIHHYLSNIDSFIRNVTDSSKSYYLFVGRPDPWLDDMGNPDDTAIPAANGSVYQHESSIYTNISFGKLIDDQNVSYMVQRYNWTSGVVYDRYDQFDGELLNKRFFVMNDNYEVYKVVDNNNSGPSLIKPSFNNTVGTFRTSDGYTWKYMYTLDPDARTRFMTSNFIPVTPNSSVMDNAVGGTIDVIRTLNGGRNYRAHYSGYISSVTDNYNLVLDKHAAHTNGYYSNSSIYLRSGFGAGQLKKIRSYDGLNRVVKTQDAFKTYIIFNVADVTGSFNVGQTVTQNLDSLFVSYIKGAFNVGDTIVQADTTANGLIVTANASVFKIVRNSVSEFELNKPFISTVQSATQKSGNVTAISFADTIVHSNTGAFTIGETVYQSNGTVNNAVGVLFSSVISANINPNTDINSTDDFIGIPNNPFADNDTVLYKVSAGNTAITNLTDSTVYYVVYANTTGIRLSGSLAGANLNITATAYNENGHSFTKTPLQLVIGKTTGTFVANSTVNTVIGFTSSSVAVINSVTSNTGGRKYLYSTNTSQTSFTTEYVANGYIRVGSSNANNNIRRITAVNSSVITLDTPLSNNFSSNLHYSVPIAAEPISISPRKSHGDVSNLNLNGVTLSIDNFTLLNVPYRLGELVNMVDDNNNNQGISGYVSYANSTALIISNVDGGEFLTTYYVYGSESSQRAYINDIISYPTITLVDPVGEFTMGQRIFCPTGSANAVSYITTPNEQTEYTISPTVNIDGDGQGAIAYSIVNTDENSTNNISSIVVVNTGTGYTYANVTIEANALHGTGAIVSPTVSPARGHGYNVISELGARYAGITVTFDTGSVEDQRYPVYGDYRRVGIIQDPLFRDVFLTLDSFDRVEMTLTNKNGYDFQIGEILLQPNSNFAGVVSYVSQNGLNLQLQNARGEFSANSLYANGASSNDNIVGLTSGATANVAIANTIYFTSYSDVEVVSETKAGANAYLISVFSNTEIKLTNVNGRFDANDTIYNTVTNAYANVTGIYVSNGNIDVTSSFGKSFVQRVRFPLTSNTEPFIQFEKVRQNITNSTARVISNNNEYDVVITDLLGSFNNDNVVSDSETLAEGLLTFANSTYLRITATNGAFQAGGTIINNLGASATIANSFPALVLDDVNGFYDFQYGTYDVIGSQSGAMAKCVKSDVIVYPELVRDTGTVTYLENLEPFTLSNNAKETIKLVIKF